MLHGTGVSLPRTTARESDATTLQATATEPCDGTTTSQESSMPPSTGVTVAAGASRSTLTVSLAQCARMPSIEIGTDGPWSPAFTASIGARSLAMRTTTEVTISVARADSTSTVSTAPVALTERVRVERTRGSGQASSRCRCSATNATVSAPSGTVARCSPCWPPMVSSALETMRTSEW